MIEKSNSMFSWLMIFIAVLCLGSCKPEAAASARKTLYLPAPGMHCDGCVNTLETTLRKMVGVDSVHADLSSKNVLVIVDTTKTTPQELLHVIAQLGFTDAPESASSAE